jgi:hypothetical protein
VPVLSRAVLALACSLLLAAPAQAQLRAVAPGGGGPELSAGRVLWTVVSGGAARVLAAPVGGGAAVELGSVPVGASETATLAAGAGAGELALSVSDGRARRVLVAPATGGAFTELATGLAEGPLSLWTPSLALTDAGVLAISPDSARVYDASGRSRSVALPPGAVAEDLAAGGGLGVAPTPDGTLVVFDLRTDTELRQIALGRFDGTTLNGLAISPSGDVAATVPAGDGGDVLLWAPAGASRVRVLATGLGFGRVATAGGRVAYASGTGLSEGSRVLVVDAASGRTVFRGPPVFDVGRLSFDGTSVAFAGSACSLVGPAVASASRRTLPPGVCVRTEVGVSQAAPLVRSGRYRVRVACISAPARSCRVRAQVRTRGGTTVGRASGRVRVGAAEVLALRLSSARHRAGTLRLTVTVTDPDGRSRVAYDL